MSDKNKDLERRFLDKKRKNVDDPYDSTALEIYRKKKEREKDE